MALFQALGWETRRGVRVLRNMVAAVPAAATTATDPTPMVNRDRVRGENENGEGIAVQRVGDEVIAICDSQMGVGAEVSSGCWDGSLHSHALE